MDHVCYLFHLRSKEYATIQAVTITYPRLFFLDGVEIMKAQPIPCPF